MQNKHPYELDFEQYIRNAEPAKKEKSYAWSTAIGLQQVDGLTPSKYLFDTARRSIDGEITIAEAKAVIDTYYESKTARADDSEARTEEADKVSARIAQILSEKSFNFSPSHLIAIHGRLFEGIFKYAGKIRDYDISKPEWVLDGDSVIYGAAFELRAALDYDFEQERKFSYKNLSMEESVRHIAFFVSRIWQIHAFGEGNTRTAAVFAIKYLRSLGFAVDNNIFAENAWYFRNALVRANYTNLQAGIEESLEFLEKFFRNLLMGERNELKNRLCHVRAESLPVNAETAEKPSEILPANLPANKTQRAILALLLENNRATYDELAEKLGKTRETVRANLRTREKNGLIERVGADKNGHWNISLPHA